jgi:hypothetical protein
MFVLTDAVASAVLIGRTEIQSIVSDKDVLYKRVHR